MRARSIASNLRWKIVVKDRAFDLLYPEEVRHRSPLHWTPVRVAMKAARWLAPEPTSRVLDIGSGSGKVCCVGALSGGGQWHGVERDRSLVDVSTVLARQLGVDDAVTFSAGDMESVDWRRFDSFYLYNPFASILFEPAIDRARAWKLMLSLIAKTETQLAELPSGTRVVTFHGFGGDLPDSYTLLHVEMVADGQLAVWTKRAPRRLNQRVAVSR